MQATLIPMTKKRNSKTYPRTRALPHELYGANKDYSVGDERESKQW